MADNRKDDLGVARFWSRSDRIFEIEGKWFFHTREGEIEGPFQSEIGALHRINVYIQIVVPEPPPSNPDVTRKLLEL
tara:strand:+ start:434502 stop:434732 length:231 start_codon:yes stop_codon:yes gene_type:complete